MHPHDELKAWVGFDDSDSERLRAFWPQVEPLVHQTIDHFYERVLLFDGAREVLENPEQVERLKGTLRVWLAELVQGPHDRAYYERRERIGRRHVEVGLPARYMFAAMSVIRHDLCHIARRTEQSAQVCDSIERATSIDLAIMTGTYVESRERVQLRTLQNVLVGHLPVTVLVADNEGMVVAATVASSILTGRNPEGAPYTLALPEALVHAADLEAQVQAALEDNESRSLSRVDAQVDGVQHSYQITVVPLDHPQARFLLHVEDNSEAIEIEGRMQRSEALAQLGALSAAVAHELRNPLAGISGAVQVIGNSLPPDDPRAGIMAKVNQQIDRLDDLVTDLLAFARPGSARMAPTDLREVVDTVIELVRPQHPTFNLRAEGAGTQTADANLVHQILLNLVQNAISSAGEKGEVRVIVSPERVVVSDSGPGVPEGQRQDIFKPFFTTRVRGTGLGLAVSRRAAGAMGATVSLLDEGPLPGASFALDFGVDAKTT